jgi:uncharacterized protein (TIGR00251 family)
VVRSPSSRLELRVSPGAKRSAITGRYGEGWKVRVNAVAEKGKANEELVRLLGKTLDVARTDVTIVRGHGGRDKLVEVVGLRPEEIEQRLARASDKSS